MVIAAALELSVVLSGRRWRADPALAEDLSIPLRFDGPQPAFFGVAAACAQTVEAGTFIGDVRRGGSVNCARYSLAPHCNGTHTECVGHITNEHLAVRDIANDHMIPAVLLSVFSEAAASTPERSTPAPQALDRLITRRALEHASSSHAPVAGGALIVRTMPNESDKLMRNYDAGDLPPYFSAEAMAWIVEHDIRHLVVDLPSIDRAIDEGHLTAHRLFWGVAPGVTTALHATRATSTITELAYVDAHIVDGTYLLNLQVAPFDTDAAPSRPILYPLVPA